MVEHERDFENNFSASQKDAAKKISAILQTAKTPQLILLTGISGTGKSFLLEQLGPLLDSTSAQNLHFSKIFDDQSSKKGKHIVTTLTPKNSFYEHQDIKSFANSYNISEIILKPMSKEEIVHYIQRHINNQSQLTTAKLADYSSGIPYLAHLLSFPLIGQKEAAFIAAGHIKESLAVKHVLGNPDQYLNNPLKRDVAVRIKEMYSNRLPVKIYDNLVLVIERQTRHARLSGKTDLSPVFVAGESEEIFNRTLEGAEERGILIHVPAIEADELQVVLDSFGFSDYRYIAFEGQAYRFSNFAASFNKVSFFSPTEDGRYYSLSPGEGHAQSQHDRLAIQASKLPIKHTLHNRASITIETHDHTPRHPARVGWLTESMLQQLGVSYYTENKIIGINYYYDPVARSVIIM